MKICTHNGRFHSDEVLACSLLKILPKFSSAEIIRTRDPNIIQECDVVVDVGGIYNHDKHRYDHHQRTFTDTFSTPCEGVSHIPTQTFTRLSSVGLIYKHFGREIISHLYPHVNQDDLNSIFLKLYDVLIEEYDAIDNGINPTVEAPKFVVGTSSVFSQVGRLNYVKGQQLKDITEENAQFCKAMELCKNVFLDVLQDLIYNWLPAKSIVLESVLERIGPIVILKAPCAWKDHIFDIENKLFNENSPLLYILYEKENSDMWMAQAIPKRKDSFESRLGFPESWRGLRDSDLEMASGIAGGVFVHATGFLAGANSKSVAIDLINASLSLQLID